MWKGGMRLPPGFRFHPTDEELILHYLKPKLFSFPFPSSIIPHLLLSNSDPWDLSGDLEKEMYFFRTKEPKYPNGKRSNRATNSGYWKATGLDKQIIHNKEGVGMKKTLVFYTGKPPHGSKTDWIMHEYRLLTNTHSQSGVVPLQNWVLCKIFLKKRGATNIDKTKVRNTDSKVVFYDFLSQNKNNTTSSSSDSSGITQISTSTYELDKQHEGNSSCNTSSY
ncbi:PREDICTED: NAC domain-containing protein 83-like isoform X2 [Lupinus angustifolius]|uniref:NAC domain-containing protein 83-like isoform X2 n=1 Tax=Lupinus angustifolius TaxID=3871 RepID=UPI00092E8A2B|nr:PREDICTED: NAC domain-containing protein 83-like isoform X2 [Lupinus angustifolius]